MNKKLIIPVAVLLAIAVGIGGYYWYNNSQKQADIILEKESELGALDKIRVEEKVRTINDELNKQHPEETRYNLLLDKAEALIELGLLNDAERSLKDAINLRPKTTKAYSDLFELQVEMNATEDAEETIEKIMELNPTGSYWRKYIDFLRSKRNLSNEEANDLYRQALQETQENINVVTAFAMFLEDIGDKNRAKEYWTIAGRVDPEDKAEYDAEIERIDSGQPRATEAEEEPATEETEEQTELQPQ